MLLVTVLVFTACGKTGDLYLPDENTSTKVPAKNTTPKAEQ
jgi:predicted small lipoprotein YifL